MPQTTAWEKEYQNPQLISKESEPQNDVKRFLKWLQKNEGLKIENLNILDLGSGTGRNANYLAELGNKVSGLEISKTAIELAKSRARELQINVDYQVQSIGSVYPFADKTFDLALDITSSNSLDQSERKIYLSETSRVLKPAGYFFVRALCKDGDKNAKNLLKLNPGKEYDTYINTDMNLTERVFGREDFIKLYSKYFQIKKLDKKTSYARFRGQNYKRNYWLAYLKKA